MKPRRRAVTLSASMLALAMSLGAQSSRAAASGAWGDTVNGVQLRAAVVPAPPGAPAPTAIWLPAFTVQMRNDRDTAIRDASPFLHSGIEIDGVRYVYPQGGSLGLFVIGPRSESPVFPVKFVLSGLVTASPLHKILILTPGQHVVRVVAVVFRESTGIILSNPLTITVPDVPASVERQALIDGVVGGNVFAMQSAAPILVAKYPGAVLGAFQAAARASRSESMSSNLILWLATVPGDDVTAFLLSQLAPSADSDSRSAATTALLRRDPSGIAVALTTWRAIQPTLRVRFSYPDEVTPGGLISALVRSGDAAVLDTLARTVRQDPATVRMSVVAAFMPPSPSEPPGGARIDGGFVGPLAGVLDTLPRGAAEESIVRLLRAALDDSEPQHLLTLRFRGDTLANPRVCDLAAMVFAQRWPDKYQFHWQASTAQHDAEIAVIRRGVR